MLHILIINITVYAAYFMLQEFFLTVKDILRRIPGSGPDSFDKWTEVEKQLNKE